MKKTASILLVALFTLSTFAQGEQRKQRHQDFTADQMAEIQTKKMTLHLDLTADQQEQIFEINKQNAVERKQKMEERKALKQSEKELSSDEIFTKKSARLDNMIAHKAAMKKILSDAQFEKWETSKKHSMHKMKKRKGQRKMHHKRMRK
jgi:hypothetical protein